jgi:hypothetical protein
MRNSWPRSLHIFIAPQAKRQCARHAVDHGRIETLLLEGADFGRIPLVRLLREVRDLVGERRASIVFDRGGCSPKLFDTMIKGGFDLLTYRNGRLWAPSLLFPAAGEVVSLSQLGPRLLRAYRQAHHARMLPHRRLAGHFYELRG